MSTNPNFRWGTGGWGAGRWGNYPVFAQPIGYYLGLFTSQYQDLPKFQAFADALLRPLQDAAFCLASFDTEFDIDYATGPQLDSLGSNVGAARLLPFEPSGGVSPLLDDVTYRLFIKATIAANQWDGTISSLQSIWQSLFPGGHITITDGQDMSATIFLTGSFSSIVQDLIQNGYIVPRPEGVRYIYVFSTLPAFGFDSQNSFISGFDQGHWS